MELTANLKSREQIDTYITSALKCLLADEVIIMNKVSACMLDESSAFAQLQHTFSEIYNQLKLASESVSSELKSRTKRISISINDIVSNTSLKRNEVKTNSKVAILETLSADNNKVLSRLEEVITDLTIYNEEESKEVFKQSQQNHLQLETILRVALRRVVNRRSIPKSRLL